MILRRILQRLILAWIFLTAFLVGQHSCAVVVTKNTKGTPLSSTSNSNTTSQVKESLPKFGEVPTNRVLPVDQLTDADYEDIPEESEQNTKDKNDLALELSSPSFNTNNRDYCIRMVREEIIDEVESLRLARQLHRQKRDSDDDDDDNEDDFEEEDDEEQSDVAGSSKTSSTSTSSPSALAEFLDFEPGAVVGPLISLISAAGARNTTAIDQHYKRLPPDVRSTVKDVIDTVKSLVGSVELN